MLDASRSYWAQNKFEEATECVDLFIAQRQTSEASSRMAEARALRETLRPLLVSQRQCVNTQEAFDLITIDEIPRSQFFRAQDGYGYNIQNLLRHLKTSSTNPHTRNAFSPADIVALQRHGRASRSALHEAVVSHRNQAREAYEQSDYARALEHSTSANRLAPDAVQDPVSIVRIDSLAALRRYQEALDLLEASVKSTITEPSWHLQIRRTMLEQTLAGKPIVLTDPPAGVSKYIVRRAHGFLLHCLPRPTPPGEESPRESAPEE